MKYLKLLTIFATTLFTVNHSPILGMDETIRRALVAKLHETMTREEDEIRERNDKLTGSITKIVNSDRHIPMEAVSCLLEANKCLALERELQLKRRAKSEALIAQFIHGPATAGTTATATVATAPTATCDECHERVGRIQRCSGCKQAKYCGLICQRAAWLVHKKECNLNLNKVAAAKIKE